MHRLEEAVELLKMFIENDSKFTETDIRLFSYQLGYYKSMLDHNVQCKDCINRQLELLKTIKEDKSL